MAQTARGLQSTQWTNAIQLIVLDIQDNQNTNKWQTEVIDPPGGGRLQLIVGDSFLAYRRLDADDVELERGGYPSWMVVSIELVPR